MLRSLTAIFLLVLVGRANGVDWHWGGYVESLSSVADYPYVEHRQYDELIHARLNNTLYVSEAISANLDIRMRVFYGNSVENIPDFSEQVITDYEYTDLDLVLWDEKETFAYSQIDRLWLDYWDGDFEATLGRQRVAWGTALVWNVIDLFNPKSVLDFDYEEKPGADVIRVQYFTGALSKLEVVGEPAKSSDRATIAGLFTTNLSRYDFYAIAGVRENRWLIGGAWAGSVLDGGFRGEFLYSQAPNKAAYSIPAATPTLDHAIATSDRASLSVVLSGDYTFSNSFYIHSECLYNSLGQTHNAGLYQQEAAISGLLSPARWSLYQEFAYDITPLMRATLFGIWNPSDGSSIMVPSLTRSLSSNLELLLIGLFGSGENASEYGQAGNAVYVRLKLSY